MDKEFDISKIVVKLRNLNTLIKDKLVTEKLKVEIANSHKAVIGIDTDEEDLSSIQSDRSEDEWDEPSSRGSKHNIEVFQKSV